jgi:HD-GYP domain-containing protein (c-di-GMP phosphodiesterase class II)
MEKASQVIIRSTAVAVSIVLLTAIVLYPIIMRLVKRLEALSIMLLTANLNILKALGSAVAKRDSGTDAHNYRVTIYAVRLAEAIGLDNESIRVLIKGAFLHDVGKIGIKDFILHKPGRLTVEEYDEMKLHVSHGLDIIRSSEWLDDAAAVVGGHHEKYDGSGYDREVAGVDIPIIARIFSIVDVFDALTSARPYKGPMSYEETMNILNKGRGKDFDPELLDAFSSIAGEIYDKYAGGGGSPEDEVIAIEKKYFISDIAQYLR